VSCQELHLGLIGAATCWSSGLEYVGLESSGGILVVATRSPSARSPDDGAGAGSRPLGGGGLNGPVRRVMGRRTVNQSINQSVNQPVNQSVNQSIDRQETRWGRYLAAVTSVTGVWRGQTVVGSNKLLAWMLASRWYLAYIWLASGGRLAGIELGLAGMSLA
jgi:hypothetical protein